MVVWMCVVGTNNTEQQWQEASGLQPEQSFSGWLSAGHLSFV